MVTIFKKAVNNITYVFVGVLGAEFSFALKLIIATVVVVSLALGLTVLFMAFAS